MPTRDEFKAFFIGVVMTFLLCAVAHINTDHNFSKNKIEYLNKICEPHGGVLAYSVDSGDLTVYCSKDEVKVTTRAM